MDPKQPLASVVMVDYNGGELLIKAVKSVLSQTIFDKLKFILVDNASTDGCARAIAAEYGDKVHYVRSEINLGFAGGNNLGFQHSEGKYLLLLNNDAEADPIWAEQLISTAEESDRNGMVTSRILYHDTPSIIDNAGHDIYPDGLNRSRGNDQLDAPSFGQRYETFFASGCAALYLRTPVLKAGCFDEDFFAYGDDVDLGLKLRRMGYICIYEPKAKVLHHGSATSGRFSLQKIFWIERNRVWILIKYFPLLWLVRSPYYTFRRLISAWKSGDKTPGVAQNVRKNHSAFSLARTILSAWFTALAKAPQMWQKRRHLQKIQTISPTQWENLLKRFSLRHDEMNFSQKNNF